MYNEQDGIKYYIVKNMMPKTASEEHFRDYFFDSLPPWGDEDETCATWARAWFILTEAMRLYGDRFNDWLGSDNYGLRADEDEDWNFDERGPLFAKSLMHHCISEAAVKSGIDSSLACLLSTNWIDVIDCLIDNDPVELRQFVRVK